MQVFIIIYADRRQDRYGANKNQQVIFLQHTLYDRNLEVEKLTPSLPASEARCTGKKPPDRVIRSELLNKWLT